MSIIFYHNNVYGHVHRSISIVGYNNCGVEGGNFWSDNQADLVQTLKFRSATRITKNASHEIHYAT